MTLYHVPFLAGWEEDERNGVVLTVDGQPVLRPSFAIVEMTEAEFQAFLAGRDLLENEWRPHG